MIDDGVHGLLVEPRDPDGLADALGRLLTDDALHARLSQAGRARICERFDSRRTTVACASSSSRSCRQPPRPRRRAGGPA
jgi:glycosyltransferase involved in cell wall biosynthesis